MQMYMRFMVTLAGGLLGVGVVLKVLLDGLFHDWDAVADLGHFVKGGWHHRHTNSLRVEDVMLELEKSRTTTVGTNMYESKRRELKELSAIEDRLHRVEKPVVLTPILPSAADIVPS